MEKDLEKDLKKYFKVSRKILEIMLDSNLTYNEMVVVWLSASGAKPHRQMRGRASISECDSRILKYTDTILTLLESNVWNTAIDQLKELKKDIPEEI